MDDREKLYRHIAESDPVVWDANPHICWHCKARLGRAYRSERPKHNPDCWYVWCCERVENWDASSNKVEHNDHSYEVKTGAGGREYFIIYNFHGACVGGGVGGKEKAKRRIDKRCSEIETMFEDEQNTGGETV